MRSTAKRGRVYRRCGCRDDQRRQLGARCPLLATDPHHGTWTFAVDSHTTLDGRRHTVRRGGFPKKKAAKKALHRFLEGERTGFSCDPDQTVADYLDEWFHHKQAFLKPTTIARYRRYVYDDLVPAFRTVLLDDLARPHLRAFVTDQLAHQRGEVTVYRILATLSSALGDGVRNDRLPRNIARPMIIRRPRRAERPQWTADQAARFLRYAHGADPLIANFTELLIGSGIRRGEALALHEDDAYLDKRFMYIRWTLAAVDNNQLVFTAPKTRSSRNWVALSDRATDAIADQITHASFRGPNPSPGHGLVFHRHGRPLRPGYVLDRFHRLCHDAGVPVIRLHDLRHLACTLAMDEHVPVPIVSKTLRHSTLSTTVDIYHFLSARAAREAVDAIDHALNQADSDARYGRHTTPRTGTRPITRPARRTRPTRRNAAPTKWRDHTATTSRRNIKKAASTISVKAAYDLRKRRSGRQDLNLRPLDPQRSSGVVPKWSPGWPLRRSYCR
ncbi:tyrosine-type recombinase/integrase [Kitasatospora sp. NPDC058048]|uniref:tyrosine-type recombinase/integrase n=1 Tax=Kitasatospora sp. NPDC058048 TaxID=3346313 RepID=UPI0036DD9692